MTDIAPLETLYQKASGPELPLPPELANYYGTLSFPLRVSRSYVIANFVSSLDGVVALNTPGYMSGGDISGFNAQDRMVMALLRSVADAIVVGAGTLRVEPRHIWTASHIRTLFPAAYQQLRAALGKSEPPLNVIVTASGAVDLHLRLFQSGEVPALIVTTQQGAERLREQPVPPSVQIAVASTQANHTVSAHAIIAAINSLRPHGMILLEGGPILMGNFFEEHLLNELFLTLSPQVAGRDETSERPGLVSGTRLAPEHAIWGTLVSVKRGASHLFLRYTFH
ncbi:MAG TPA: dihydrofolate reductase family protein [Ktedonobacteraceae bacterium]|nr:dihydrofolate reductase family protein [Ktedonobacteraceae bacterium]